MTTTITIRVSQEEKKFLKDMANFLGISLSDIIRNYSIKELETIYDTNVAENAYEDYLQSDQETVTLEELKKMI
ncbi:type II toxin-antitoxin system RelB family antitoxin [Staphylococcus simulans]